MFDKIKQSKLTVNEIFSYGWEVSIKNWRLFGIYFLLSIGFFHVIAVPSITLLSLLNPNLFYTMDWRILAASFFIGLCTNLIVTMMLAQLVEGTLKEEKLNISVMLKKSFRRLLPAIGTMLLLIVILFFTSLLILPGIYFMVLYFGAMYVVILRGKRAGTEALKYSKKLVRDNWWRIFGILLLFSVLGIIINEGIEDYVNGSLIIAYVGVFLSTFVTYYFNVCRIVLFLNLDYLKYPTTPMVTPSSETEILNS